MKKLIATLLALCMVLSFLPATALAAEPIGSDSDLDIDQEASAPPTQAVAAQFASGENAPTDQVMELEENPRNAQAVELEHCHPSEPTLFSGSDEAQPYLKIGIMKDGVKSSGLDGKITITDYSTYYLYATYVDKNHNETDVTTNPYCKWNPIIFSNNKEYGGSAEFEYEYEYPTINGHASPVPVTTAVKLKTYQAGALFSFTASYAASDGTVYSEPCVVEVVKLNNGRSDFLLQCAALSKVVYTDFASTGKIGEMIAAGTLKDGYKAKDEEKFISTSTKTGATWSSFYSATISDWELCDKRSGEQGFYGALFKNTSGEYVLAFRGTEPLADLGADLWNDIKLGTGHVSAQLKQGLKYYIDLRGSNMIPTNASVTLTGHSLGGGIANYVSDLRGISAVTFNAPSTMVSAIRTETSSFAGCFDGLDFTRRIDYVNFHDWVGNTGIGDNPESTSSQVSSLKNHIGSRLNGGGGSIDKTTFVEDQSGKNGEGPIVPYHYFNQLLTYDMGRNSITIRTFRGPELTKASFRYLNTAYVLGTKGSDNGDNKLVFSGKGSDGFVFGGNGDDRIYLESPGFEMPVIDKIIVCGGRGEDTIQDVTSKNVTYYYFNGDGFDKIIDHGGSDTIEIFGCNDSDIHIPETTDADEIGYITVKINNKDAIKVLVRGKGQYTIKNGDTGKTIKTVWRISQAGTVPDYTIACPVDVYVYDTAGNLACKLPDGTEMDELQSYGHFSVVEEDGEFVKRATLFEDGYTVKMVGTGTGTMQYTCTLISDDDEDTVSRTVENIPVTVGATYTAVGEVDNDTVLLGEGNLSDVVFRTPESVQVNADTTTLRYGESTTVHASVYPEMAVQGVMWSSSDSSVAVVDQNGIVTAVGAGSAEITAVSAFDDTVTAACSITVSNETFSMDDVEISGINSPYIFTGYPVAPDISASLGAYSLIEGIDYSAEYENNVNAGTATVTLTGNGYFEGTRAITFTIRAPSVSEKVNQLVEECLASGAETDYDKALWFHDWLIYNADYDHTYQNVSYRPEGVLINGRGVCQSYADAYSLLLTAAGIENIVVTSYPMNHAWNIVKIDGIYTHIDCTWDDPNSGGLENHTYFGLGDREMETDHIWAASLYPECQKLRVIVEEGALPAPYDLFDPVAGVDFTLIDSSGKILTRESIEAANGNVLLVFGRPTCSNTRAFLDKLSDMSDILEKHGTQVIAVMESMEQAEEIAPLYPFTCAYEADCGYEGWQFNQRIGLTSSYTYPQVVLQNSRGSVFYYSTGYVYEPLKMVSTAIQDLPLTDRIPYSPTYLYSSEDEMYACIRTALANRETDIKLCNPANASVSSSERSAAIDYVGKNAASYGGSFSWYRPSFGNIFIVGVEYASEDSLPDPDPFLDTPLSGIDLSFADASGNVHSSSEYGNVLLVYGRATCSNTQALLRNLHMWKDVLDRNDVTVIAVLESQSDVAALSDLTPFQCMADTDGRRGMWNVLDQWGTLTSVTYPAVFFQADTGEILYVSTGYVYEPDKLVATVIQGQSNDNHDTYRISFDANGGTLDQPDKTVVFGEMYGPLPTPTKAGYTFDGWFTAASGGIEVTSDSLVSLTEDQTLYAHWRVVESEIVPVVSIALNKTEAALTVGDTATLTATVTPENATNKSVTWTSSNPDVATVVDGVVTAKATGSVLITATTEDGGFEAICEITVNHSTVAVTGITLDKSEVTLTVGGTATLMATVTPENATNKIVDWTSSDPAVVTVKDGVVTANAIGSALITATTEDGGFEKKCAVIIVDIASDRISLTKSELTPIGNGTAGKFTSQVVCPDSAENKSVIVVVAFYNNNGRMLTSWLSTCALHNGGKVELTGQLPLAENNTPHTLSKVFVLESEKLHPLFSTTL